MATETVVVTGACGSIGRAISKEVRDSGIGVIGVDREHAASEGLYRHIRIDLAELANDSAARDRIVRAIADAERDLQSSATIGLVNNAAVQVLGDARSIDPQLFRDSLDVNVVAPFVLAQSLYERLATADGCIVNIGSIHARLTKAGFCPYSVSKSALSGLSRALAVEWGARVRTICIEPAAVATPMLEAGFAGRLDARHALDDAHPSRRIGSPEHIASWVVRCLIDKNQFSNGMLIRIDGGIGSRLFDPA